MHTNLYGGNNTRTIQCRALIFCMVIYLEAVKPLVFLEKWVTTTTWEPGRVFWDGVSNV
jgi:hypothetical protein